MVLSLSAQSLCILCSHFIIQMKIVFATKTNKNFIFHQINHLILFSNNNECLKKMNVVLQCLILVLSNLRGLATYKPLLTDQKNGLHLVKIYHHHCPDENNEHEDYPHQFHFKIVEGFCEGDGLLICYPSQWTKQSNRKIARRFDPNFDATYGEVNRRCEEARNNCTEFGGTENCGNSAHQRWHGILVKTEGATQEGTNLTLHSSFLGEKYNLGNLTDHNKDYVVELNRGTNDVDYSYADEFKGQLSAGAFLYEYKRLWLLGLDVLPHQHDGQQFLELFVYRSCGCTLKAWLTNPTNDQRSIVWDKADQGNEQCGTKADQLLSTYSLKLLKPFNETSKIVLEALIGENPEQISVAITKDHGELSWIKYIKMLADRQSNYEKETLEWKKEEERLRGYLHNTELVKIVFTEDSIELHSEGNSKSYSKSPIIKKGAKITITIYFKRFSYEIKIEDSKCYWRPKEIKPESWFERLPYEHMDNIQIKGDMVLLKQIIRDEHSETEKTPNHTAPYYMKLDKATVQADTVFKITGELWPNAKWLRIAFLYNAFDRNLIVGETIFELCANLTVGKVTLRSYPYDRAERNSQRHSILSSVVHHRKYLENLPKFPIAGADVLALSGGNGFDISVKFGENAIETWVNMKKMEYIRKGHYAELVPLWKITNVAVSGHANLFIKPSEKLFTDTGAYHIETKRRKVSNFTTRLEKKLLPGDSIMINGKLTQAVGSTEETRITITLLSETDDPNFLNEMEYCKKLTGMICPGFIPLKIEFYFSQNTRQTKMNVTAHKGDEMIDIFDKNVTETDSKMFGDKYPFNMQITVHYDAYEIFLDGTPYGKFPVGVEQANALPAWLAEYIHIYGILKIDPGFPKIDYAKDLKKRHSAPRIMGLDNPLEVGDKVTISAKMKGRKKDEMFEIGFYNRGWSHVRPFSRIQFNIRFDKEPNKVELYSDFWTSQTNDDKQKFKSYSWKSIHGEDDFYMEVIVVSAYEYEVNVGTTKETSSKMATMYFKFADESGECEQCVFINTDLDNQQSWSMPIWSTDFIVVKQSKMKDIEIAINGKK